MSVSISSRRAEFFSVCASVATVTSCVAIIATVYFEKKALQSYYLKLVIRLLASDLSLGVIIIFYYIMQGVLQIDQLRDFCKIYLPAVIYFYLASFGWTIMLAQRFRTTHAVETKNRQIKAPLSLKWVWAIPSISALIILICNFTIPGGVSVVEDGDSNTNRSCSFDHSGVAGMTVDILCFQIPMIVTILADLYCYSIGLYALRNTPRSVRSRQERRAGGYLAVLLLVWIPAFLYNIKALHQRKNNENGSFQDAVVFLSALQGFLNSCVYVWSNKFMRKWLLKNLVCYRVCCPSSQPLVDEEDEEDYDGSLQDALASNPHMRNTFSEPDFYYDTDTKSLDVTLVTQHNILHTPSPTNGKGILVKNINGKRPQSNKKTSNEFLNVLDGERYVRFGEVQQHRISSYSRNSEVVIDANSRASIEEGRVSDVDYISNDDI